ncbi:hypothetical protein B0H14DRAFT_2563291 [Mycena olivaceomarginata]|nr:hypothetical protein B0H14DRAFT_2563291 [Mycena olivaceomarginata]
MISPPKTSWWIPVACTVLAIIDWECAGWFPAHWKICKMINWEKWGLHFGWRRWISKILPGDEETYRQELEADALLLKQFWVPENGLFGSVERAWIKFSSAAILAGDASLDESHIAEVITECLPRTQEVSESVRLRASILSSTLFQLVILRVYLGRSARDDIQIYFLARRFSPGEYIAVDDPLAAAKGGIVVRHLTILETVLQVPETSAGLESMPHLPPSDVELDLGSDNKAPGGRKREREEDSGGETEPAPRRLKDVTPALALHRSNRWQAPPHQ